MALHTRPAVQARHQLTAAHSGASCHSRHVHCRSTIFVSRQGRFSWRSGSSGILLLPITAATAPTSAFGAVAATIAATSASAAAAISAAISAAATPVAPAAAATATAAVTAALVALCRQHPQGAVILVQLVQHVETGQQRGVHPALLHVAAATEQSADVHGVTTAVQQRDVEGGCQCRLQLPTTEGGHALRLEGSTSAGGAAIPRWSGAPACSHQQPKPCDRHAGAWHNGRALLPPHMFRKRSAHLHQPSAGLWAAAGRTGRPRRADTACQSRVAILQRIITVGEVGLALQQPCILAAACVRQGAEGFGGRLPCTMEAGAAAAAAIGCDGLRRAAAMPLVCASLQPRA